MSDKFVLRELSRYELGTFADIIYRNALLHPDDEAFVCGSERTTFQRFNERVNRLVHGLEALGIRKGDVIGVLSWNCLEYQEAFGAAMKGGYVIAHYSPRLNAQELMTVINDSEPRVLFLGPTLVETVDEIHDRLGGTEHLVVFGEGHGRMTAYRDVLADRSGEEPEPRVSEDDPLVIFYTSGTTGTPRGALYTHREKLENTLVKALDIGATFGDRHLVVLPMFHIGGDSHIWPFFLTGGCNVIMPKPSFNPDEMLEAIVKERITDVHIVPTQLVSLLNHADIERHDLRNLKRIWYAASSMPLEVLKSGIAKFGPIFLQGYGQTESGPHTTVLTRADHGHSSESAEEQNVLASCGQPCIGVHMRIVDGDGRDAKAGEVGEIIVRGRRIMSGYWHRPEETAEAIQDGWLYTGDMGFYDEKGYIYIADRKKDMIITGGENVFPKEVEDVLYRHPAVEEAAVVGVPDPYWVERVHAVVVLKGGASVAPEEIVNFCREHVANFKAPKSVEFVETLPKSPQGKILKREIRARYWKE